MRLPVFSEDISPTHVIRRSRGAMSEWHTGTVTRVLPGVAASAGALVPARAATAQTTNMDAVRRICPCNNAKTRLLRRLLSMVAGWRPTPAPIRALGDLVERAGAALRRRQPPAPIRALGDLVERAVAALGRRQPPAPIPALGALVERAVAALGRRQPPAPIPALGALVERAVAA